jgi:hypothetical protein
MNINHSVRNSIYRTGRAAALRVRLTISPFFAAHVLRRTGLQAQRPRITDRQVILDLPAAHNTLWPKVTSFGRVSALTAGYAELVLCGVELATNSTYPVR